MSIVVPDALELEVINTLLNTALTIHLYSNDKTPDHADTTASYTEVAGGGYASKPLTFANWTITAGQPTTSQYNAVQTWNFTGPTNAPGNIYGYYVTRDSDGKLMWADRFSGLTLPFVPIAGSTVRILPKFNVTSQF